MDPFVIQELSKNYNQNKALDNISFKVKSSEIFGVVGPDGAGKTTLLRILAGVLNKTSGKIFLNNLDIDKDSEKAKHHIGYMSQKFNLYPTLTVEENIRFFAGIFGVPEQEFKTRVPQLLALTGLLPFKKRQARDLSGGMKQKLALISTLIHKPHMLILDEPTLGVDPVSRRDFWQILQDFSSQGTTVLVSTSYMDEAELCNRIILLYEGKIILKGNPVELKKIPRLVLELIPVQKQHPASEMIREIKKQAVDISYRGSKIRVLLEKKGKAVFIKKFSKLFNITEVTASIEDVFINRILK